jgi:hypothetical protein
MTLANPDKRLSTSSSACLSTMLHCVIAHEDRNTGISSGWLQRTKIASWLVGFVDVACDHLADKRGNNTANYENLKKIIIHGISAARPVGRNR